MSKNILKVKELSKELMDALQVKIKEGYALIDGSEKDTPTETVTKIKEYVDTVLSEEHTEDQLKEYGLQLGALWAEMVIKQYFWKWKYLDFGDEAEGLYIVSPRDLFCTPPMFFLTKIITNANIGHDGKNDNTVLLLFKMIEDVESRKTPIKYRVMV